MLRLCLLIVAVLLSVEVQAAEIPAGEDEQCECGK